MSGYDEWVSAVDTAVWQRAGLSLHDLADVCLADWYEDGMSPRQAAQAAIRTERGAGGFG